MITERIDMITRVAEAAIEAGEISGLRPSIVGALVISALQAPTTFCPSCASFKTVAGLQGDPDLARASPSADAGDPPIRQVRRRAELRSDPSRLSKNLAITTAAAAKRKPGRHPDLRGDAALTF
jgi:hypothetical protein